MEEDLVAAGAQLLENSKYGHSIYLFNTNEEFKAYFDSRDSLVKKSGGITICKATERAPKTPKALGQLVSGLYLAPIVTTQTYICSTVDILEQRQSNFSDNSKKGPLKFNLKKRSWIETSDDIAKKKNTRPCEYQFILRTHSDNSVSLAFKNEHMIHNCEKACHLFPLSTSLVNRTVELHEIGLPVKKIRMDIVGTRLDPENRSFECSKESLVTLREIKRTISKVSGPVFSDPEEVLRRVNHWSTLTTSSGRPAVNVLYKAPGSSNMTSEILKLASDDQLVLIKIIDSDLLLLEKYGHVLYIDATHNTTKYQKIKLLHLMISTGGQSTGSSEMERQGRSYSVAQIWTSQENTEFYELLFKYLFSLLPSLAKKIIALVTDLAEGAYSGLSNVLKQRKILRTFQWIHCKYHLVNLIRDNTLAELKKVPKGFEGNNWPGVANQIYNLIVSLIPVIKNNNDPELDNKQLLVKSKEEERIGIIRKVLKKYKKKKTLNYLEMRLFNNEAIDRWSYPTRKKLAKILSIRLHGSDEHWKRHILRVSTDCYCESSFSVFKYGYQNNESLSLSHSLDAHQSYENDLYAEQIRNRHFDGLTEFQDIHPMSFICASDNTNFKNLYTDVKAKPVPEFFRVPKNLGQIEQLWANSASF